MSNCYDRMVPKSFAFSASVNLPEAGVNPATVLNLSFTGGVINELFGERDRVCQNRLLQKYYQSISEEKPCLIKRSNYARPTLPPPYPYPRVGYGTGYRYPEHVEFNADRTKLVVRYLVSPTSEEIAWPTTVPALLVSRTGSPQVETIAPEAWTGQTIYARLELINGVKTITNFLPTYLGSGAILYPNAPNDPKPTDLTIPRLFPSQAAFDTTLNISHNGFNNVRCSGCGLCDFELINLPEDQWSWSFTSTESYSGTGFGGLFLFDEYRGTPIENLNFSPIGAVSNVNLNPQSRACQKRDQALTVGLQIVCTSPDPPYGPCFWDQWITFIFEDFKLGSNNAESPYYDNTTATANITITAQ